MSNISKDFETVGSRVRAQAIRLSKEDARIPILITGVKGGGQEKVARWIAKSFACKNASDGIPCDNCPSCRNMEAGMSADLLWISPQGASDLIKIAQIRPTKGSEGNEEGDPFTPLTEFNITPPIQSRNKIVVIHRADRLYPHISNLLLTIIENPQSYMRYIFTTEALGKALPTILSRCLRLSCDFPELKEVHHAIKELTWGSDVNAQFLSEHLEDWAARFYDWLMSLPLRTRAEALRASQEFLDFAEEYASAVVKIKKLSLRAGKAEFIELFANGIRQSVKNNGNGLIELIEMTPLIHKAQQGNARMEYLSDYLFTSGLKR